MGPDASLEAQANYKTTEDFKDMLRQVINSESTIENALKLFPDIDDRYSILKHKKNIVDQLIKLYGVNNKRMIYKMVLIIFISNYINQIKHKLYIIQLIIYKENQKNKRSKNNQNQKHQ